MGADWYRFRLRSGVDVNALKPLIEEQARAFQSMNGWERSDDFDGMIFGLAKSINQRSYALASEALAASIEMPHWDQTRGCATDLPTLIPCWRVNVIRNNRLLPPEWRIKSQRSILPRELGTEIAKWQRWLFQVGRGDHDEYLRELYLTESTDRARYHWGCLRNAASGSLRKKAGWAHERRLDHVRNDILRFVEPVRVNARLVPDDDAGTTPKRCKTRLAEVFASINELKSLNARWNRAVPNKAKVHVARDWYVPSFEEFKRPADDNWVRDFFAWADECREAGFGFYLDA